MNLSTKLTEIKGVGERTGELLANAGLETTGDLINFLPRTYEDYSKVIKIADLAPGKVTLRARCETVSTRIVRRGMRITTAVISDDSGKVQAVWFNQPYRETQLKDNKEFYFSGQFDFRSGRYQLTSPSVEAVKDIKEYCHPEHPPCHPELVSGSTANSGKIPDLVRNDTVNTARVLPIYPTRKGLKPNVTRKILNELRPLITMLPETLPDGIVTNEKLLSHADALIGLHFPESKKQADDARERLAFEELFSLILAARLNKQAVSSLKSQKIPFNQAKIKQFVDNLPFTLTAAQKRALWDILQDFEKETPVVKSKIQLKLSKSDYEFTHQVFLETEKKLRQIVGEKTKIEHVGSTSVKNLDGKGVIDIALAFPNLEKMKTAAEKLLKNGFQKGKTPTPDDRIMMRTIGYEPTKFGDIHLHLMVENGEGWNALIGFRDWLREKPENAQAYLAAKHQALAQANGDRKLYGHIKRKFIEAVQSGNDIFTAETVAPMNRLLQGDVGSGKTVVAGAAAYQAALAGYQTAIMAPTEILATQHAETLRKLLAPYKTNVALLTGSVKGKPRAELLKQIANGTAQVVVGTHALFQATVKFHKLAFVVIDEQHRFGVKQRQELLAKGKFMPHLLSMTATPIPRSLQLTLFGDLDISILNQLPKGRKPIKTEIVSPNSRAQMNEKIKKELVAGRQVYFIAPMIEDIARTGLIGEREKENVERLAKKVAQTFCHSAGAKRVAEPSENHMDSATDAQNDEETDKPDDDVKVGILHGKMKPDEKEKIMREFAKGEIQILCATTVVEVGVDVPNATVIVIENADQFGLAQLHQLRGRVGRGEHQSFVFLVQSDSSAPTRRLREIEKSNDGFYLAEVDLKLRGAGEIYGTMQHGELNLQIANLADTKLIKRASTAADNFIKSGTDLSKFPELQTQIQKYQRLTTLN